MAGTTVADDGLVMRARSRRPPRRRACRPTVRSASTPRRYVLDTMGQSKIVVFRALFGDEDLAQRPTPRSRAPTSELIDDG